MGRFRLSTLLFLTALAGLAFGWYRDRQRLEVEIDELRVQYNQAAIKAIQADIQQTHERMLVLRSRQWMFEHLRDVAPPEGFPVDQEITRLEQQLRVFETERSRLRQLRLQEILAKKAK